uniref:Uncharacterized protein n=1 Tax=Trypanosoma vivax (strain Y486) TaxID=1055687 RepID=G0TW32_TRYVY|nr:conserved hypothetical protein [Trypanosoma vivax Y486]
MLRLRARTLSVSRYPKVPVQKLHDLLVECGLGDIVKERASVLQDPVALQPFAPLFTPYFTIENQHLTTRGDIIIDEFLSNVVLKYTLHAGLILTVNACKQLNAVLHNHFTLRLFAKELHFDELTVPLNTGDMGNFDPHKEGVMVGEKEDACELSFLEAKHVGLSRHDVAGTSFQITPLRCGQSTLGWIFSHFVGAVHRGFGQKATQRLLLKVYGDDLDVRLPSAAASLLLRTVQHFPPGNVAEAILAAQGLQAQFVGKTRVVPGEQCREDPLVAVNSENSKNEAGEMKHTTEMRGAVICSGFGVQDATRDALTLDELANGMNTERRMKLFSSLAAGPGGFDSVGTWRKRAQRELALFEQPPTVACGADNGGAIGAHGNASVSIGKNGGWLQSEEWKRCKRGPAFYNSVDFSTISTYFADTYGTPHPVNGQKIARNRFRDAVRDPAFYDKESDMRNGVPFSADGEPLANYLDRLARPHARLFEVSLLVGGRAAGRAVAWRYTTARESACQAYLGAVLHDLQTMKERSSSNACSFEV